MMSTIASQAFDFLPALFYNLVFFALTGWALWFRFGGLIGPIHRRITILLIIGVLGLILVGFLSLGLAMAGWFSVVSFYGVWAMIVAILAWDGRRRGNWMKQVAQWRAAQPLPAWFWLLICLWLLLYCRPFEMVIGGSDPGVYVNIAKQIAEQGTITTRSPIFAGLAHSVQEQLVWNPDWLPTFIPHKLPGFFWIADSGKILPQFFHFYPALMAPSCVLVGYEGALTVLPVIMLIFALLLAELAWLLLKTNPRFASFDLSLPFLVDKPNLAHFTLQFNAVFPAFFLLLNPAMFWFGRFANADVPYGLFVFAALFFWARATEQGPNGRSNWLLMAVCLGAAQLTKIDSLYLLPAALVAVLVFHPTRKAQALSWLAWSLICVLFLIHVYAFSYPYFLITLRSSGFEVPPTRSVVMLLAAGYLVTLTISGLIPPILSRTFWEPLQWKLRLPAIALPVTIGTISVLGLVALIAIIPHKLWMWASLDILLTYVPWPTLTVAAIGITLLISRIRVQILGLPLLATFLSSGMFIVLQTPFIDHPWSERRATSLALPMLMLFAGVALAEVLQWISRLRVPIEFRSRAGRGQKNTLPRMIRRVITVVVLTAVFIPMAWRIPPVFAHQEAQGARSQLRLLGSIFPDNAVILSGGTRAIDLFGLGLSVRGGREILSFYSSAARPEIPADLIGKVGDAALAARRPFFFVATGDEPPPGHFLWARAWWGEWTLRQMVSKDSPEPLKVEDVPVSFRIYRAISVASAAGPSLPQVRLYEAEALLSQTGRLVEDATAGNGWARAAGADRDTVGALVYGPYTELPPGSYIARYHLRVDGDISDRVATLAVLGAGTRQLASRQVDSAVPVYSDLDVPFELHRWEKVEFSLFFEGVGQVWLDRVEVVPLG
jgi:hypothetical protein